MERGRSSNNEEDQSLSSEGFFHPIGTSTKDFSCMLQKAGFAETSTTTTLGVVSSIAAASASASININTAKTLVCPEMFDEHAALVLHLRSYVLACGLIAPSQQRKQGNLLGDVENDDDFLLFRRLLCPWEQRPNAGPDLAFIRSGLPIINPREGTVYTEIEVADEASVRNLFQSTYYKEYTDKYPAIRKMVKGVLNKDLRETATTVTLSNDSTYGSDNPQNTTLQGIRRDTSSAIGNFYRSSGGIFLVAVRYTKPSPLKDDNDNDNGNSNNFDVDRQKCLRQVVGCVGIRSYEGKDADASRTLEIFRLAVDANHRGLGIARNLLQAVERYAQERRNGVKLKFIANTLTILEAAVGLYESCGYRAEKDTPLGTKLVQRTYVKDNLNTKQ